ncbi:MAG: TIM44-like domain-containing protein [Spirochaetota bacterium]
MEHVYFEGQTGIWDFRFGIDYAQAATIVLENLPAKATAWLFDDGPSGKLISRMEGKGARVVLVDRQKLTRPHLVISGARAVAPDASAVLARSAQFYVNATIRTDSTIQATWKAANISGDWFMPVPYSQDIYLGELQNARPGKSNDKLPKHFLEPIERSAVAGYTAAFSAVHEPEVSLDIPIGKPDRQHSGNPPGATERVHSFSEFFPITFELPTEQGVTAEVLLCSDGWDKISPCKAVQRLVTEAAQQRNILTVRVLQPVLHDGVVLRLKLPHGSIRATESSKLLRYQVSHYWYFGDRPMWVKWVSLLASLAVLVPGVIFLVRNLRIAQERAQIRRIEETTLRDLRKQDPAFDLEAFRTRGKEIAARIQASWCAGDMRDCRRLLSQGIYNRFRLQLKIMREMEKRRNAMRNFTIKHFYVVSHNRSGVFDCLTVRMDASARDLMVELDAPEESVQAWLSKTARHEFTEFYSFMRRQDTRSSGHEHLDECSRCGTPFQSEGELNKCRSCGSVAGCGTFDWVLAEITQHSEYKGITTRRNMGDFSSDRLEDRAAFLFWRHLMASLTGTSAWIGRDATENFLSQALPRQILYDIAVGATDLESFKADVAPARASVRIKWSAASQRGAKPTHRQSLLRLSAPLEAAANQGFADPGCPACGAPLPETDSETCAYCRSTIARKNADWLLESIETTVE